VQPGINTGIDKMDDKILLAHGNGGSMMHELITGLFHRFFFNHILNEQSDAAILPSQKKRIAFTTDSYVVDPIFFPGGDIGKLSICGTVNDLAVSGAKPQYISVSFIIEEGFPFKDLETIVKSMSLAARKAKVKIVTGDTKVVQRGKCDKIFITTSGVGFVETKHLHLHTGNRINPGDVIIINGTIGDHGMAVMNARESFRFKSSLKSDCTSLNFLINRILGISDNVHFIRDATRGGMATILCEIAEKLNIGIELDEVKIPIKDSVNGFCELLGFDPLYIANEGKIILVVGSKDADIVLREMKKDKSGRKSEIIGIVIEDHPGKVVIQTKAGGKRIMGLLIGEQLPRIC
jgi:hydrogenase expression/formation protein HypE